MYSLGESVSMKEDWGHSSNIVAIDLCHAAAAKRLALFHHEPTYDDDDIARMHAESIRYEELTRDAAPLEVICAYDGLEIHALSPSARRAGSGRRGPRSPCLRWLCRRSPGERARNLVFDLYQRLAPRDLSDSDVRVVLIDSDSLASIGPWPWPRYHMARLTEEIAALGATVIGFDILFSEPDRVRPDSFVALYPELSAAGAAEVAALEPMDRLFGKVVGMAPVVLARAGADGDPSSARGLPETVRFTGQLPARLDSWRGAIPPIPEIGDAALGQGLVNGRPDSDGVVRSVPLAMRVGGRPMTGFAFEVARASSGHRHGTGFALVVRSGGRALPVDRRGRMLVHFGEMPARHVMSADAVIRRAVPGRSIFSGKIVVVGLSAEGTSDIVTTPLAAEDYGALIQAQAVDAVLRGGGLERPRWAGIAEWAAALALALLALVAAWGGRARRFAVAALFVALPVASWFAFQGLAVLLDPLRPLFSAAGPWRVW